VYWQHHTSYQRRTELSLSSQNVGENFSHVDPAIVPAWKKELNERLAATRLRRAPAVAEQAALPGLEDVEHKAESRAAKLAAKVAKRYANAPTYSEVLAAGARARIQTAPRSRVEESTLLPESEAALEVAPEPVFDEPLPQAQIEAPIVYAQESVSAEIEPLAVNLVEFPRELIAARKMRPRLAEGPLRETFEETEHDLTQLKIFEVAPESISQAVSIGARPAGWSPIRLDSEPISTAEVAVPSEATPIQSATVEDRIMAGIFDLALIVAAFAVFILVFAACTTHPPTGKPALLAAGLVLAGFCLLYQYLFFKFAEGTPGMRYAKIALCTFDDENPTRQAMCRRVFYLWLSAAPLGLGFLWACFDPDRLSWHDRLSRIYQRSYS
jgi:uncharacterized RDD family membrane protein YckC